jgi:hypothetical protein
MFKAMLVAPLLLLATTAVAAQTTPSTHEQHQATGQHQAKPGEKSCPCCEEMMHQMHQMMTEMHKMHQGMGAHSGHNTTKNQTQPPKQ